MKKLQECISENITIQASDLNEIAACFQPKTLGKSKHLIKAGTRCREMAFIESGYVRMYDVVNGDEITLWIGSEGNFITSLSSFVLESPNYWNIQALTEARLQVINREDHFRLLNEVPKWLEFDNLILTQAFAMLEKRMLTQLHTTARERYRALIEEEPELFNHVPLQHIASMLGIKPETLSRLRKERFETNS